MNRNSHNLQLAGLDFAAGGGEMGERIRSIDWSQTSLGAIETWPQSLRSAVSILLPSKAQIAMFWGPDLITLYNDAYIPVLGTKHPRALGLPVWEVWSELWGNGLKELFEGVLKTGEAFWASDRPFFMERYGFREETYFDISYDPVRDETGQVGGLFCIVSDTTARVIGARRLRTLRDLSVLTTVQGRSVEEACRSATQVLSANRFDLPFALIYLLDANGKGARLVGASGANEGSPAAPLVIDFSGHDSASAAWPGRAAAHTNESISVNQLDKRFGPLPSGVWPESPHTALVVPIAASGQDRATGFLVAGVSPRRPLDDQYKGFIELLANQIAITIGNARAYEEERKRAEILAELDRAKTLFFSNVSHEFRTPLTLMTGPLEDALAEADGLSPANRERLELAHRNSLRLLKLVNTLLDFSRIEAGRIQASFEPTDLSSFTAELASVFRSAVERAGLRLIVDCPPLSECVYVDREMWEKIVLNLLSNAFKFTFAGEIEVSLRQTDQGVRLAVRDTGTGIPSEEIPRLFERFHRVKGAQGRSYEGSGIGLALVHELVKLHDGKVDVTSAVNQGSTFSVSIPRGAGHLPADRVLAARTLSSTQLQAEAYLEEARRWLPDEPQPTIDDAAAAAVPMIPVRPRSAVRPVATISSNAPRILLADDNADMRRYVQSILSAYEVEAVNDGQAALRAARERKPDLVLTDVMMPLMDGFELLRELRADPQTCEVPVILLSARAGEESRIEGLQQGADDYLIKPFSARELLARVDAHVRLAGLRRDAARALRDSEERYRRLVALLPVAVYTCEAPAGVITFYNQQAAKLWGRAPQPSDTDERFSGSFRLWRTDGSPLPHQESPMALALQQGRAFRNEDLIIERPDGTRISVLMNIDPIMDHDGRVAGAVSAFHDTSALKSAQEELRLNEEHLRAVLETTPACIKVVAADGTLVDMNAVGLRMVEADSAEMVKGKSIYDIIAKHHRDAYRDFHERVCRGERGTLQFDIVGLRGSLRHMETHAVPLRGPDGIYRQLAITHDITERKKAEDERDRLISVIEYSPDFIGIAGRDQRAIFLNRAGQRLVGLSNLDEVRSTTILDYFAEDERERVQREIMPMLLQHGHWDGEVFFRHFRTKERIPVRWNVFTLDDPVTGQPGFFACVSRDISEQKRQEALLEGQKRVLEQIAEGAPLAEILEALCEIIEAHAGGQLIATVLLLDEDGVHLRPAAGRRAPRGWTEAIDRLKIGPNVGSCGTAAYLAERVVAADIATDPLWANFRDSALHFGLRACWSTPIFSSDNKVLGTFAVYYDRPRHPTTQELRLIDLLIRTAAIGIESKHAAEAIEEQNSRLKLLWEAAGVLLSTDEPDAMLQGLFAKIAKSLSLDVYFNFMVTENREELQLVSCAGVPAEIMGSISRLPFGRAICGTVALRHKPIVATYIQDSAEPMVQLVKGLGIRAYACNPLMAGGELLGTLSFASRTRDEFTHEEIEFLETISQYVTVAYERLRLIERLRDQDRRKDEFLATLAHELRNPLAPIRNALQILKLPRVDGSTLERSREMMDRQVDHLVRLVDDLLDVSRVMRGKIELRREHVELAAIVARAVETVQPLIDAQQHSFMLSIADGSLPLYADQVRLAQVIGNLLTNAAKYTEAGGKIWLTADRDGDMAVLRVRDNGIGIAPAMLPRVFDLFVQLDHAASRSQGGLGIGLTLVKNLVEMHHGTVAAHSPGLGQGSEFVVRLPLVVQPTDSNNASQQDSTSAVPEKPGRRLLVVDDHEDAANSLAMLLRLQGHQVHVAYSGLAALELTQQYKPDLVFLDIGMPGMDGYEVARRIRQRPDLEDVVLIALTGWGQRQDRRRTADAGFNYHLVKPLQPEALENLLQMDLAN